MHPVQQEEPLPAAEVASIPAQLPGESTAFARATIALPEGNEAPSTGEDLNVDPASSTSTEPPQAQWTVLKERQKKILLILIAFVGAISPFSTSTYYPSVVLLSRDLHVSVSKINLTISTYQIFQGIAPAFVAAFADTYGRRPAYIACFVIYFGANLGLALQDSYAALLVLRALQSSGSSGTSALGQGVVTDLTTRSERGKYLAYVIVGVTVGPALGPVAGGLLAQYLGWRSVFWFLLILGSCLCILVLVLFPETSRSIVGDGSIPAPRWNQSLLQILSQSKTSGGLNSEESRPLNYSSLEPRRTRINPLKTLALLRTPENFILCVSGGFLYAGYTAVTSVFASQLQARFGYSEVQVGLCYLPIAFGSLTSGVTSARLIDKKFRKEAEKLGMQVEKNVETDIAAFDTEKARLFYAFPMIALASALVIGYGWEMQYRAPLAVILVTMFFLSHLLTGTLVANTTLLTDLNRKNAAAVGAASNLTRCLLSAGGVAAITPMIDAIGIGWASVITAAIWLATGLSFGWIYVEGFRWRQQRAAKKQQEKDTRQEVQIGR